MNKLALVLSLLGSINLVAQDSDGFFKPEAGNSNLEFQLTPFGNSPIGIYGIRGRKFKTDNTATRLNLFLSYSSDSDITQQEDPDNDIPELRDTDIVFAINLRPGFEKHLPGTKRLSPYFGGEFDLALQTSTFKSEFESGTDIEVDKEKNVLGFFRVGVNAIAGFDFYVAERLYLGAEMGFGVSWRKDMSITYKSSAPGFVEPEPIKRGGAIDVGPNVVSAIRIGYIFNK